ncbi:hypothetical protein MAR_003757, partial [Mya arenaria]
VEIHSDTSSENDVVHIRTEGVQYAVVQGQPVTQRIETMQPHNDDSLTYAELDKFPTGSSRQNSVKKK